MHSLRPIHTLLLLPVFAALPLLPGCNEEVKGKRRPYNGGGEAEVAKVAVVPKDYGTVTGKITYDGTPEPPKAYEMGGNAAACHQGAPEREVLEEYWIVGPNGGVKNVVVILQPGDNKYFRIPEKQLTPKDVEIEQPRCSFIPRVFTLFPTYWDGNTNAPVTTNQKLIVHNNAAFDHNFNQLAGQENPGKNVPLRRDAKVVLTGFVAEAKPLTIKCDIHSWMRCYGFVLDHPYAAVTKDDGTFTIENAPLGVDVQVVCWHEAAGFFNGGAKGTKITLENKQVLKLPQIKAR